MIALFAKAAHKIGDLITLVIKAFAALAKSNSLLMGDILIKDYSNIKEIMLSAYIKFN